MSVELPIKPLVDYRDTSSSASSLEDLFITDVRGAVVDVTDDSDDEISRILDSCHASRSGKGPKVVSQTADASVENLPTQPSNRTKRRFDPEYDNLPPVDEPSIHVEDDVKLEKFGVVHRYVDFMVVIKPLDGVKHLDFDTLLFNEDRNAVGEVFEILGRVNEALYTIRFNNEEEARYALKLGDYVYYAPDESVLTKVVLTTELMKMKISDGNDGSGEDDEFSDDEAEAAFHARRVAAEATDTNRRPAKRCSRGQPLTPRKFGGFRNNFGPPRPQPFFPPSADQHHYYHPQHNPRHGGHPTQRWPSGPPLPPIAQYGSLHRLPIMPPFQAGGWPGARPRNFPSNGPS